MPPSQGWTERCIFRLQTEGVATGEGLKLNLKPVPKVLGSIKRGSSTESAWAPEAFVISFKLETDSAILLAKAASAIRITRRERCGRLVDGAQSALWRLLWEQCGHWAQVNTSHLRRSKASPAQRDLWRSRCIA